MIGFHLQGAADNWPDAARRLPPGAPIKFVDGVQRAAEAKGINPDLYTVIRHHVTSQPLPAGDKKPAARAFFQSFVDDSFKQIAWAVDAVQEWNEYLADSQSAEERQQWTEWVKAVVEVWRDEYRTQPMLSHIDLILCEVAVGNNIPMSIAKIAHDNPFCVLGYHPYIPVHDGIIQPNHWPHYSGRWEVMDETYRQAGWRVRWFFGEFGAVGVNGEFDTSGPWPNSLAASDGWRHKRVYDGQIVPYVEMIETWMRQTAQSVAWQEGRVLGATIFTTGGGSEWKWFETKQPEMSIIADRVHSVMDSIPHAGEPPQPPPPPPPPDPFPPDDPDTTMPDGAPRVDYRRVMHVLSEAVTDAEAEAIFRGAMLHKETVGWSYDDAGIGAITNKTAVLHGLQPHEYANFQQWYATNYPGTKVVFRTQPQKPPEPPQDGPRLNVDKIIDVSHWQGEIDWVKARQAGVTDAYIKLTEGKSFADGRAMTNARGCMAAGIRFGFYHFWNNGIRGAEQAAWFEDQLKAEPDVYFSQWHRLPLMFDLEENILKFSLADFRVAVARMRQTGLVVGLYLSAGWIDAQLPVAQRGDLAELPLWLAAWDLGGQPPRIPPPWKSLFLHQTGQVFGPHFGVSSAALDMNIPGSDFERVLLA